MSAKWLDLDEELASFEFLNAPSRLSSVKKKFDLSGREKKSPWDSLRRVNNIFDLASSRRAIFDNETLWDSVTKDNFPFNTNRNLLKDVETDRLFADIKDDSISSSSNRLRDRFARRKFNSESESESDWKCVRTQVDQAAKKEDFKPRTTSVSDSISSNGTSYNITDVTNDLNKSSRLRKTSSDYSWSRKSSFPDNVTFPVSSSSNVSENSVNFSEKLGEGSECPGSAESVCTEKSFDCSSVSEILPDGTNRTKTENQETWMEKNRSGSRVAEKKFNDSVVKELGDNKMSEKSTKQMSYMEKFPTGHTLQEETSTETILSCDRSNTGVKTPLESRQAKGFRSTPNKSVFYDELDSCAFQHYLPTSLLSKKTAKEDAEAGKTVFPRKKDHVTRGKSVAEKISKLIDEAVEQDTLFKPSNLHNDIKRIANSLLENDPFPKERVTRGRDFLDSSPEVTKPKQPEYSNWKSLSELKSENDALQQENTKLQSIIQDVTSVNKRWQKYNYERRLYVQKLLSTIQSQQEQINRISERNAFQTTPREENIQLETLKKDHKEHITVLELQIKSHKDDWNAERKEKEKAIQENEELQEKIKDLTREIKFLKNVLQEERNRKLTICSVCQNKVPKRNDWIFPRVSESLPAKESLEVSETFIPKTFRTSVHVPYSLMSENSCNGSCFSEDTLSESPDRCLLFMEPTTSKSLPGQKDGNEDSGLLLSIEKPHPSEKCNDVTFKSIMKKNDKKLKLSSKSFSGHTDIRYDGRASLFTRRSRKKAAEEFKSQQSERQLAIDFQDGVLASVTSFSQDSPPPDSDFWTDLTNGDIFLRSKSEPNTRSNSPDNVNPLREALSWNDSSSGIDTITCGEGVVCPSCVRQSISSVRRRFTQIIT